jgi:hypothetical protein
VVSKRSVKEALKATIFSMAEKSSSKRHSAPPPPARAARPDRSSATPPTQLTPRRNREPGQAIVELHELLFHPAAVGMRPGHRRCHCRWPPHRPDVVVQPLQLQKQTCADIGHGGRPPRPATSRRPGNRPGYGRRSYRRRLVRTTVPPRSTACCSNNFSTPRCFQKWRTSSCMIGLAGHRKPEMARLDDTRHGSGRRQLRRPPPP